MAGRMKRVLGGIVAIILVVGIAFIAVWGALRPRLSETEVRRAVVTTIQAEAPASFYITGTLDITATATVENTKYLFPDVLRLDLGTTRATVRLPGRLGYGFNVMALRAEDIRLVGDGVVEVTLPALRIFSVEPDLSAMEVQTEVGWARMYARSGQRATAQALAFAQEALREQGAAYLETATQPRINTAQALQKVLTPPLQAAGLAAPRFRIRIGPDLVTEPEG